MSESASALSPDAARFTTGSTMRHVVIMTATGSIGLTSVFLVDFADMYFLSLLGEREVAGAIGYAGSIIMLNISACIGLSIATSALVARAVGAGELDRARQYAASTVLFAVLFTTGLAVFLWFAVGWLLHLLGASGEIHAIALTYSRIIIPSLPLLGIGMCLAGALRAIGDAKRSMYTTLSAGIANAVLDPVLIFGLGMGVPGAAVASVAARVALAGVGLYCLVHIHRFLPWPRWAWLIRDLRAVGVIAVPAMMTNIATPFSLAYVTAVISGFGTGAVAAWAIIGRLVPLCFGVVFVLSGAVGPIIGQNFGARRGDRVLSAYLDALKFAVVYVLCVSLVLYLLQDALLALFSASPAAAALVSLFCTWLAASWSFAGAQYVAHAAFNNLGKAHWSTLANWGKATVGTIPFVYYGAQLGGAEGALWGLSLGTVLFGIASAATGYLLTRRMAG